MTAIVRRPPRSSAIRFSNASFFTPLDTTTAPKSHFQKTHLQKLLDPPPELVVVVRHELGELARAEGAELLGGRRRRRQRRGRLLLLLLLFRRGEVPGQDGEPLRHLR